MALLFNLALSRSNVTGFLFHLSHMALDGCSYDNQLSMSDFPSPFTLFGESGKGDSYYDTIYRNDSLRAQNRQNRFRSQSTYEARTGAETRLAQIYPWSFFSFRAYDFRFRRICGALAPALATLVRQREELFDADLLQYNLLWSGFPRFRFRGGLSL